jgi:hypothetical protein
MIFDVGELSRHCRWRVICQSKTHVLLSIEEYQRITGGPRKIADALAMPGLADVEFDPPRVNIGIQPVDLALTGVPLLNPWGASA